MMDRLIKNKDTVTLYSKLFFYRRMDLLRSKKNKNRKGKQILLFCPKKKKEREYNN